MDVLSLVGIILAFVAIVGGNFLEGGHAGALLNGPAALIVIGGTLAAALLQACSAGCSSRRARIFPGESTGSSPGA